MKIIRKSLMQVVWSIALLVSSQLCAQENIKHLFYCNSTNNISKLWIIDDNTALGTRTIDSKTTYIRDIVLVKNGLFIDSLSLNLFYKTQDYRLSHINDIIFYDKDQYLVVCSDLTLPITIKENRIIHEATPRLLLQINQEVKQLYPYLQRHNIGKIGNILVGYKRTKVDSKAARAGISLKDEENFPEFWVAKVENQAIINVVQINQKEDKKTNDLFIDIKDWEMVSLRTNTFQKFYSYHDNKIFFNVPRANKCYVYNVEDHSIKSICFPPIEKGESCFYYYDHVAKQDYFVKKKKGKKYEIFQLKPSLTSASFLKEIDFFPHAIVNGKIHRIAEEKEGKNNFKCHYMMPILEDSSVDNPNILKEITIQIK
jgi:hypothetical protein